MAVILRKKRILFSNSTDVIQPPAPAIIADNSGNTLRFTSSSNLEISINNGAWQDYNKSVINIGDINLPYGYYRARVKAEGSNPPGNISYSPVYTASNSQSLPSTLSVNIQMSNATGATSTITDVKYDKKKGIAINFDDAAICALRAKEYMDTQFYTDGCGNNIPYTSGLAVIGNYTYDAYISDPSLINHPQRQGLSYTELPPFINANWDIENHSHTHSNGDGVPYTDAQYLKSVTDVNDRALEYNNYKINFGVVPVNFYKYFKAFKDASLLGGTSQGFDGSQGVPMWDNYAKPKDLNNIPDWNYFAIQREFAVQGWTAEGNDPDNIWGSLNEMFSKPNAKGLYVIGTHSWVFEGDINYTHENNWKSWIQKVKTNLGDTFLFTSAREFLEYIHIKHFIGKTDTVTSNNLKIDLNYNTVPNKENIRWYDQSFIIGGSGTIQNVTCSDSRFNVSFNPTTRLVNIKYNVKDFNIVDETGEFKIPYDKSSFYLKQTPSEYNGIEQMFDGVTKDLPDDNNLGYGGIIYTPNYLTYSFGIGQTNSINKIRYYDSYGNFPFKIEGLTLNNTWVTLLDTNMDEFGWQEVIPTKYEISKFRIVTDNSIPSELEIFCDKELIPVSDPIPRNKRALKDMTGVNMFSWSVLMANGETDLNGDNWRDPAFDLIDNIGNFRHYMDWNQIEVTKGNYQISPAGRGNWDNDLLYQKCKENDIFVVPCVKDAADFIVESYPADQQHGEVVPTYYTSNRSLPSSYIDNAKAIFQVVARYGNNTTLNNSLILTADKVKGKGQITWIEINNENNRNWRGTQCYMRPEEYAAYLSACYDGHKNTMGSGIGAKNADSTIKVSIGGMATDKPDYFRYMIDWCIENRGYLPNGDVDLPFDAINWHSYPSNTGGSQTASSYGVCPEYNGYWTNMVTEMNKLRVYKPSLEMWIGEIGYDTSDAADWSDLKANAIGSKDTFMVDADWRLRISLMAARTGVDKIFFYEFSDQNFGGRFGHMGYMIGEGNSYVRKPWGNVIYQLNQYLGNSIFDSIIQNGISNNTPCVDKYINGSNTIYALWMPTMNNSTANYTLQVPNGITQVTKYEFDYNGSAPIETVLPVTGNQIIISVTEKPIFIKI